MMNTLYVCISIYTFFKFILEHISKYIYMLYLFKVAKTNNSKMCSISSIQSICWQCLLHRYTCWHGDTSKYTGFHVSICMWPCVFITMFFCQFRLPPCPLSFHSRSLSCRVSELKAWIWSDSDPCHDYQNYVLVIFRETKFRQWQWRTVASASWLWHFSPFSSSSFLCKNWQLDDGFKWKPKEACSPRECRWGV